jgi:pimeloyl-ACP methyl ester carboxylesterase
MDLNMLRHSALIFAATLAFAPTDASLGAPPAKPTVILVHGAFAGPESWNAVAARLRDGGYPMIAAENPLRGVRTDAEHVGRVVAATAGPVILVGHSYGGSVISDAAAVAPNVKALVFVSAFAPDLGETAAEIVSRFPGATLAASLAPPTPLRDGGADLRIDPAQFQAQFAADVPAAIAEGMAVRQRPIREAALAEPAGPPTWRRLPTWFIYGDADKNIPAAALA